MKTGNNNLLNSILSSVWMVDTGFANMVSPLVIELLKGNKVDFPTQENKDYLFSPNSGRLVSATWGIEESIEDGSIAVVSVKGGITRYTQMCGPRGTKELNALVQDLDNNPKISAIVFDIDTPGGEANFLDTFAETIRNVSKPTIGSYSGLCCSAGYYIGSSMDELYAQEKTDVVGSIGAMTTVADYSEMYEKAGVKLHEIYSNHSPEKNQDYYEAIKGNYEPIQQLLDEYSIAFIEAVKQGRPQVSEKAFKGKTYTSRRAKALGLIDGVKTFEQAIERATELGALYKENNSGITQKNKTTMEVKKISEVLGFDSSEMEAQDGQVSFSIEDVQKIEEALASIPVEAKEESPVIGAEQFESLTEKMSKIEERMTASEQKIEVIGKATNIEETVAARENDEEAGDPVWNQDENINNKAIDKALGAE